MTTKKTEETRTSVATLVSAIEALTIVEVAELAQALRDKFGIGAAAFAAPAAAGAAAPAGEAAAKAEEQAEFAVTLVSVGDKKIQVLKELRALTGLGLKEAKDLIDKTPSVIKEAAPKEEADKIKAKLEEVGAKVEVK